MMKIKVTEKKKLNKGMTKTKVDQKNKKIVKRLRLSVTKIEVTKK